MGDTAEAKGNNKRARQEDDDVVDARPNRRHAPAFGPDNGARLNNRLESVFDYQVPYDDTTLSLSSHNNEIRRSGMKQIPGNSRGQTMAYQSIIEIHARYSKRVVEEREMMRKKYADWKTGRSRRAIARDLQALQGGLAQSLTEDDIDKADLFSDVIAPLHDETVFNCKTGNILFCWVPWGTRTPAEVRMPGESNVVVEDCFNGLSNKGRLIFWGFAAGESCAFENDGRDDFATHYFGTGTIMNYGPCTLPIGATLFMSGQGYCFLKDGMLIPVFAPHGQPAKKVMPFPFYLNDTNIFSIQSRIRFKVIELIAQAEKASAGGGYSQASDTIQKSILDYVIEPHLTPDVRNEIMIDEMVQLMALTQVLRRTEVWCAADDTADGTAATLSMCQFAYRIAQRFIIKHSEAANYFMKEVLKKGTEIKHDMINQPWSQRFPNGMTRQELIKSKNWLESTIEHYRDVARSCFCIILEDRWMGTNANKTSPPNTSCDLLIRVGRCRTC